MTLAEDEFAAVLAEAALRRAGLQPEAMAAAGWQQIVPGAYTAPVAASPNYRITGNDNAVITPAVITPAVITPAVTTEPAPRLTAADVARIYDVPESILRDPAPPPPSTLADVAGALMRYEASRPRTVQTTLGPSELGTPCSRQIAMKLAGVQRHERGLPWAPMCGTAVHSLMEDVLTRDNERLGRQRWVIEETVHLDDELTGHGDAYDTDHALVIDWKYTGTTARRKASRKTVPNADLVSPEYRVQAHLYGLGHENAGRPVRFVRLVMLARSHDYGESVEWTEEYRPDIAVDAMTRFYSIRDRVVNSDAATHPERLADIEATPGEACKWCPFRRPPVPGGAEVDATGCVGDLADAGTIGAFFR